MRVVVRRKYVLMIVALCVVLSPARLAGDHAPQQMAGRAPTSCAGIRLGRDTFDRLRARFGEPKSTRKELAKGYSDRGNIDYEWLVGDTKVSAGSYFVDREESPVYSVTVSGKRSGETGTCVLVLGSNGTSASRKFGRAMRVVSRYPNGRTSSFEVEWSDGTTLRGTIDDDRRIMQLTLTSAIE